MRRRGGRHTRRPRAHFSLSTFLAGVLVLATATPVGAQSFGFHGLMDLVITGRGEGFEVNGQTYGDNPYDPWGLRLFGDGTISPHIAVFTQAVLHDPSGVYVEAAYVVLSPSPTRDLHLMAGKIPWPIGTYAPRSYSDKNPFIGKPLMYQYHTSLLWYALPSSADALIAASGSGQGGLGYIGAGHMGMPVVDDSFWDTGAVITGSDRMR